MKAKYRIPLPTIRLRRKIRWSRILARGAGRVALTELLGEPFASTFVVMFPTMRWRRVIGLWLWLVAVRRVTGWRRRLRLVARSVG